VSRLGEESRPQSALAQPTQAGRADPCPEERRSAASLLIAPFATSPVRSGSVTAYLSSSGNGSSPMRGPKAATPTRVHRSSRTDRICLLRRVRLQIVKADLERLPRKDSTCPSRGRRSRPTGGTARRMSESPTPLAQALPRPQRPRPPFRRSHQTLLVEDVGTINDRCGREEQVSHGH
jgi:hypothetical protein